MTKVKVLKERCIFNYERAVKLGVLLSHKVKSLTYKLANMSLVGYGQ